MKHLVRCLALAVALFVAAAARAQSSQDEYQREFRKGYEALIAGRHDEGIASMKRCIELEPRDSTAHYNLACAYSLKKELDTGFEWLGKCVELGFSFARFDNHKLLAESDTDLAALRADARFAPLLERIKAQMAAADAFVAQPVVYVPAALASAELVPLLVVLHDAGETKDTAFASGPWKALADELGYALILPSGRIPTATGAGLDPTKGMTWFVDRGDYGQNFYKYEKPVSDAVSAFRKQRKVDPARVHIVGAGAGGVLAFNLAISQPGLYKGVLALNAVPETNIIGSKGANAAKLGLKVSLVFPQAPFGEFAGFEPAAYANLVGNCERFLKSLQLSGGVARCATPEKGAALPVEPIKAALAAFNAPSAPAPTPAPSTPPEKGQ